MCKETNCVLYKNLHDSLYAMGKVHKWTYKENNKKYFLGRMCLEFESKLGRTLHLNLHKLRTKKFWKKSAAKHKFEYEIVKILSPPFNPD